MGKTFENYIKAIPCAYRPDMRTVYVYLRVMESYFKNIKIIDSLSALFEAAKKYAWYGLYLYNGFRH